MQGRSLVAALTHCREEENGLRLTVQLLISRQLVIGADAQNIHQHLGHCGERWTNVVISSVLDEKLSRQSGNCKQYQAGLKSMCLCLQQCVCEHTHPVTQRFVLALLCLDLNHVCIDLSNFWPFFYYF